MRVPESACADNGQEVYCLGCVEGCRGNSS